MTILALRFIKTFAAAFQPAMRHLHALLCMTMINGMFRAFIKCHDNVSANDSLNLHGIFGGKKMFRSVNVRSERNSILLYFSCLCKRIHLVAATVSENRMLP